MDRPAIKENTFSYLDLCVLAVLILCGFVLYIPSLQNTFWYHADHLFIEANDLIKTIDIPRIFHAFNTRFLVGLSYALNYKCFGPHLAGFRAVNILTHCLNAFLVYLLIKSTLFLYSAREPVLLGRLKWAAFLGAMLFLCHPIQTEAINVITERFVLMVFFFYLLTLILYIQFRSRSQKRYLFAAMGAAIAGVYCKETTVTLPVMLALYDFYFLPKEAIGKRCKGLLPFFIIVLIIPIQLTRISPETTFTANIAKTNLVYDEHAHKLVKHIDITRDYASMGRKQYFLNELNVLCSYARALVLPINEGIGYDYPISNKMDNKIALSAAFLIFLLIIAIVTHRSCRILSFGILWFFISLSVESSFIPIGQIAHEYRLYLASAGFALSVVTLIYMIKIDVRILNLAMVLILIGFSILTYQRDKGSNSVIAFLNNDIVVYPSHGAEDYLRRGLIRAKNGNRTQAISDLNKAIELNPASAEAYYNLGLVYYKQGNFAQAAFDYDKAVALKPVYAGARYSTRGE